MLLILIKWCVFFIWFKNLQKHFLKLFVIDFTFSLFRVIFWEFMLALGELYHASYFLKVFLFLFILSLSLWIKFLFILLEASFFGCLYVLVILGELSGCLLNLVKCLKFILIWFFFYNILLALSFSCKLVAIWKFVLHICFLKKQDKFFCFFIVKVHVVPLRNFLKLKVYSKFHNQIMILYMFLYY